MTWDEGEVRLLAGAGDLHSGPALQEPQGSAASHHMPEEGVGGLLSEVVDGWSRHEEAWGCQSPTGLNEPP